MIHLTKFFILLVKNFLCFEVTYVHLNQSEGTEILTEGSSAHLCIVFGVSEKWKLTNSEASMNYHIYIIYLMILNFIKHEILLETAEFCLLKLTFKWSCLKG